MNEAEIQNQIRLQASELGWLYLAVVLDLFSRQIVGWSMQGQMDKEFA